MVTVRNGEKRDVDGIVNFSICCAREVANKDLVVETVTQGVTHLIENPSEGIYYVAEINQEIIGYLMVFFEWSDWNSGNYYYIQSWYVKPQHRNQGVFKKLFMKAYSDAEREKTALRAIVDKSNGHMVEILTKLGMKDSHYHILAIDF